MTPERALAHDERCERKDPVDWDSCRCAERALTAARQREEEAQAKIVQERLKYARDISDAYLKVDALRTEVTRLTLAASEAQSQAESWRLGLGQANDKLLELQIAASASARTLQVRIAELEAGERHCDEYHGELTDQVTALREALMLPLMFHSGGVWTSETAARWFAITGTTEATTKVMCDTIRKALAFPQDGA